MERGHKTLRCVFAAAVILTAALPLFSQIGPRPGSKRRNYPLGGLGVPMPDLPEVNYRGTLKKIDDKTILLALDDGRTANFQRNSKTKFYRDSKEVKSSAFNVGDRVSLDAAEDPQAFLMALRVNIDHSPPAPPEELARADSGQGAASTIQYDKNGRPTLRKRDLDTQGPPPESASAGAPLKDQPANPPPLFPPGPLNQPDTGHRDALIEKARIVAAGYAEKIPDFICQEVMTRSERDASSADWQAIDTVSAEVVNKGGQETYRNIRINDAPADSKMEQLSGSWPIRRLVTAVSDLFSIDTAAQFRFGGATDLTNLQAAVYDFDVSKETSQWAMRMGTQSINAAYTGTVYVEKESGRALRLEMQARDLPAGFPVEKVETDVEYALVTMASESALLPMHVETTGCQRETHTCSRSIIDFRDYRPDTAAPGHP